MFQTRPYTQVLSGYQMRRLYVVYSMSETGERNRGQTTVFALEIHLGQTTVFPLAVARRSEPVASPSRADATPPQIALLPHPGYASEAGTHRSDCSGIRTRRSRACSPDRANAKRTPNGHQSGVAARARSARACSASPATVASCHWSLLQRV